MKNRRNLPILVYLIASIACAAYLLIVYLVAGLSGLDAVFKVGPASYATINVFVICACWLAAGAILLLVRLPGRVRRRLLLVILLLLLSFYYLNVLREPHLARRGDFGVYWLALRRVEAQRAMPPGYVYPPLLTSLLRPLYPLGAREASNCFKMANYAAVLLSYLLLHLTLRRYGFPPGSSAALPFLVLLFSVPLSRALAYQQVTIHVVNLILISLLFYGRNNLVSAVALCLAVNLKVTPVILLIPFLSNREWRWLLFFVATQLLIIGYTSWMCGLRYWGDFFYQGSRIIAFAYRNNSLDSFFFNLFRFVRIPAWAGRVASASVKVAFLGVSLRIWKAARVKGVYYSGGGRRGAVYNAFIPLLLFTVLVSPRMWAHYFIMLELPFLVMLKEVRSRGELALYIAAYILIFLIPVFDLFPLSYHRLAGLLLSYRLCWLFSLHPERRGMDIPRGMERAMTAAAEAWRAEGRAA